jgi:hypothetical protein
MGDRSLLGAVHSTDQNAYAAHASKQLIFATQSSEWPIAIALLLNLKHRLSVSFNTEEFYQNNHATEKHYIAAFEKFNIFTHGV